MDFSPGSKKNFTNSLEHTLIDNYGFNSDGESDTDLIIKRLSRVETRQCALEKLIQEQIAKSNDIHHYLEENREKYTESLEKVSQKEDVMTDLIKETRKVLNENRVLYGQSFDSILQGERQLRDLLEETKKILAENRQIYTQALNDLTDQEKKNRETLNELKPIIQQYGLSNSNPDLSGRATPYLE